MEIVNGRLGELAVVGTVRTERGKRGLTELEKMAAGKLVRGGEDGGGGGGAGEDVGSQGQWRRIRGQPRIWFVFSFFW